MEKKFEDDIMELERRVNWELENCEEEKRRKSINRKLERLRDELETISSSKNKGK
jgi:ribosome-interacting GTPase 1